MDESKESREKVRALMDARPSTRPPDFVNPLEKIEQLLTCPICLDRYKAPKSLPCQHTFCLPCLEGCAESSGRILKCPECRAENTIPYDGVKAFQTNYTLTAFLDIHLQATTDTSSQIEEYIHRYNLERCKICDEKSECEICAHCEKRACKECRSSHMDMLKRDLGRLLNQVKRLSNRIIEASDGVSKGMELTTLNCETTKTEVKEYFHRYIRELKKREEGLLADVDLFHTNESRLMSNLRDVLELESSNMSEAVSRLEASLKGECSMDDADLVKYKNTFTEGLEYLRNFQPDADELFCKKIRFTPGDDASKLPTAIASFGELTVLNPQFAGRYLPLEHSYLPRPFRVGMESEMYRGRSRVEKEEERPTSRFTSRVDDESSLRYRRRQALEDEAWNRLHSATPQAPSSSPWSRSALPPPVLPPPAPSSSTPAPKPRPPPLAKVVAPPPCMTESIPGPNSRAPSPLTRKPPLPRQTSSTDDTSLNEKVDTIRRAYERKRSALGDSNGGDSSEESGGEETLPSRSRIRIICRASSVTHADTDGATVAGADEPPPSPIPIQHYPGEENMSGERVEVPAWLARRRARYTRSKTNPDLASAFGLFSTSPRVQQLLQQREQKSSDLSTGARGASAVSTAPSLPPPDSTPPPSPLRTRAHERDAAEYRKLAVKVFGRKGGRESELNWPRGIATLPGGTLAVADSSNHRICLFNVADGKYIRSIGEYGSGKGQFDSCAGVATGRGRQMIVTDRYNHRVVIYDAEGEVVTSFGGHGPSNGKFNNPWGVAVDDCGTIYVVDKDNHRVQMFDKTGKFIGKFGSIGHGEGQLNSPLFVAVKRMTQEVFVTDSNNHRVCVFDSHGSYKFSFGEEGFQAGQFKLPRGIAVDQKGNVIVADSGNNRIQVFTSEGDFIATFGSWGSSAGQLKGAEDVTVVNDGSIIVSDRDNHRIQIFQ